MLRDIWKNKAQFISIFLMAFIGIFVFTGIGSEIVGLENNVADYYEETNLADGWIYSPYLNDLFLKQVWLLGATTDMERQLVVDSVADFENEPEITLHFVENNTLSKFYLVEGEPLDINDSNGVWLDKRFADAKGLEVGDNISFESNGYRIEKEIRGLGYSPEYVYHASAYAVIPDFSKVGFAYMSYKAFPEDTVPYNVLNVKFDGSPSTYSKLLDYRLNGYYATFIEQSQHPSVYEIAGEINQHKMMADILPVVFIVVSLLILLTTMTRVITHQRTQIGILKASGFKNKTIILHYVSYGFWLVLAGSLLGLILGPIIVPPIFFPSMINSYTLPVWSSFWDINFIVLMILTVIFSLAVSYYAISGIANEKPSITIKPKPPKVSTSGFIEKSKFWKNVSFNVRWNYRDAKRNKLRGIMTIIGVMGCSALLIGSFGLYDGLDSSKNWEYGEINHYDTNMVIDENASVSRIDEIAGEVNGDEIMNGKVEIESQQHKIMGSILVLNETDLISVTDDDRNEMEIGNDELLISKKMADMLGVGIGDSIKFHIIGTNEWAEAKIDNLYADPLSQGLIMHPDKLEDLGLNYTPTSIITAEHVNKSYDGIKTTNTLDDIEESWNKITETVWLLIYVMSFFACVLAVIVLYNLGLLSFTEIEREIATLKVLGFKTGDLRRLLLTQNLAFTLIGFILGVPLGSYILGIMWSLSDRVYITSPLSITNVLLAAAITFSLSIIVNLMFSSKIRKLDMVESLKSGE